MGAFDSLFGVSADPLSATSSPDTGAFANVFGDGSSSVSQFSPSLGTPTSSGWISDTTSLLSGITGAIGQGLSAYTNYKNGVPTVTATGQPVVQTSSPRMGTVILVGAGILLAAFLAAHLSEGR